MLTSATAIFSPSLALQAATATRDWEFVDAWLHSQVGNRVPLAFERNPDTLRVLLTLASLNESANYQRKRHERLVARAGPGGESYVALRLSGANKPTVTNEVPVVGWSLRSAIEDQLFSKIAGAEHAVATLSAGPGKLAGWNRHYAAQQLASWQGIIRDNEQVLSRLRCLQNDIDDEVTIFTGWYKLVSGNEYKTSPDVAQNNLNLQRRIRQRGPGLDYTSERQESPSRAHTSGLAIPDLATLEQLHTRQVEGKYHMESHLIPFGGLPSGSVAATRELGHRKQELQRLIRQRDLFFEALVARDSPV